MSLINQKASSSVRSKGKQAKPEVSFCVATYRRPDFLMETLKSILQQTGAEFEVIVSDNDPAGSAKKTVLALHDPRIRYSRNTHGSDMMSNFNNAFSRSRGELICMVADDDPLMPNMLSTLMPLTKKYPDLGMYFGACRVKSAAWSFSFLNANQKLDQTCEYSASQFTKAFLNNKVFPYVLWSTGLVRKAILPAEAMPNYGSPFLTDFSFLLQAGIQRGCVTINRELGFQTAHQHNYGRVELKHLAKGCGSAFRFLRQVFIDHSHEVLLPQLQHFISSWVMRHLLSVYAFQTQHPMVVSYSKQEYRQIFAKTLAAIQYPRSARSILELRLRMDLPILGTLFFMILDGSLLTYLRRRWQYKLWQK